MSSVQSDNDRGFELFDGNEKTVGSKLDDPAAYRLTTPIFPGGGGGGKVSFNASREVGTVQDGHSQDEMAMVRCEQDDRVRGTTIPQAEVNIQVRRADGEMVKGIRFLHDGVILDEGYRRSFREQLGLDAIPAPAPAPAPSTGAGTPQLFYSADGRYQCVEQADGNLVVYDRGTAVWDRWSYEAQG